MSQLIASIYHEGVLIPFKRHRAELAARFANGDKVLIEIDAERSSKSHDHEFAWLADAWLSLPEELAKLYPSPEHLRKRALISTGWCTISDYACTSKAEAGRLAKALGAEADEYALVVVADDAVRVCKAKSQARNRMKAAEWQASKDAVLRWVSDLIGADPAVLAAHGQRVAA